MQYSVLPLFSSPVSVFDINEDLSTLQKIKDYEYVTTESLGSLESYQTKSLNILLDFKEEQKVFEKYFLIFVNDFLKMSTNKFRLTTSWGTMVKCGGFSQFHNHRNSLYSGVFYLDESDSALEFQSYNIGPQELSTNEPTEWNIYNSKSWSIKPEKNRLVFFPSYLYHRISKNLSVEPRYSLAFNFFVEGEIGSGDSMLNLTVK